MHTQTYNGDVNSDIRTYMYTYHMSVYDHTEGVYDHIEKVYVYTGHIRGTYDSL